MLNHQVINHLFARDSKGRIKEWIIAVADNSANNNIPTIIINHGLLKGAMEEERIPILYGKNVGKSNETTPRQQAILEAESKVNKKLREGYKTLIQLGIASVAVGNITLYSYQVINGVLAPNGSHSNILETALEATLPKDNTGVDGQLLPMKCQQYYKKDGKTPRIKFPVYGQPKLNGFRCMVSLNMKQEGMFDFPTVEFRSKEGVVYDIPHIAAQFKPEWFKGGKVFDGELYIHGLKLQEISAAVRKPNANTPRLEFHIFDLAMQGIAQSERIVMLQDSIDDDYNFVKIVPTSIINNDEEAQTFCDEQITLGFEGAVFRDKTALYQFGKRPTTIVKLKRFEDAEFKILDVVLAEGQADPSYATLKCQNDTNEETFECAIEGDFGYRSTIYHNREQYKGKLVTIKFFERTSRGVPFHAIAVNIID